MSSQLNVEPSNPPKVASPVAVLKDALASHERIAISFSGAEDVVLIDMACQLTDDIAVFSIDTGRLHPETYRFIEKVRDHYKIDLDVITPDAESLKQFVKAKGLFSFYEDGHEECCAIRKVEPLKQHLANLDAWITGQRRDQSPTRTDIPQRQIDTAFSTSDRELVKYNPLAAWTSKDVWDYIRLNELPYNELHDRGYLSIGCEPCTRAVRPGEHERMGRWWWEESTKQECGLHLINVKPVL